MSRTLKTSRADNQDLDRRGEFWPHDPSDILKRAALRIFVEDWLDAVYTAEDAVWWIGALKLSDKPLYGDPWAVMAIIARDVFPALPDLLEMYRNNLSSEPETTQQSCADLP